MYRRWMRKGFEVAVPCGPSPATNVLTRPWPEKPLTGCCPGSVPWEGPLPKASPVIVQPS